MTRSLYITTGTTYLLHLGAHFTDSDGVPRVVNDGMFSRWINEEVVPRFPNFSVTKADGYWKGKPEPIRVLAVTVTDSDDTVYIHSLAKSYCERFCQEAVFINTLSSVPNLIQ